MSEEKRDRYIKKKGANSQRRKIGTGEREKEA